MSYFFKRPLPRIEYIAQQHAEHRIKTSPTNDEEKENVPFVAMKLAPIKARSIPTI